MKKSIIVLTLFACVSLNMHAQVVMKSSEPNEVCAQAWEKYHKGDVLWKTGWGLFGAGGAIAIAGGITFGVTSYARVDPEGRHVFNPTPLIGYSVFAVGAGMFVSSVPCLIVGQVQRKQALRLCKTERDDWTCQDLRKEFQNATKLWKTGWGLLGAGAGLAVIGGAVIGYYNNVPPMGNYQEVDIIDGGYVIMCTGLVTMGASVPCTCVGHVRRQAHKNIFNNKCADQAPLTFSIQSSANGLGLAMQF